MFLQGGYTPLHHAALFGGNHVIVKTLLDKECDVNARNDVS